jgi:hypothetical protein
MIVGLVSDFAAAKMDDENCLDFANFLAKF